MSAERAPAVGDVRSPLRLRAARAVRGGPQGRTDQAFAGRFEGVLVQHISPLPRVWHPAKTDRATGHAADQADL